MTEARTKLFWGSFSFRAERALSAAERGRETREAGTRGEEERRGRVRRKRAAGKVQKCIPLHAEQECKNIATGFPASRFTLDDRVDELEQWQFLDILVLDIRDS